MTEKQSKQRTFNAVWRAYFRDGKPLGYNTDTQKCVYRGPNGERCAAGTVLPNKFYRSIMEGKSAVVLLDQFKLVEYDANLRLEFAAWLKSAGGEDFLRELQMQHDNAAGAKQGNKYWGDLKPLDVRMEMLRTNLTQFAKDWGLKIPTN